MFKKILLLFLFFVPLFFIVQYSSGTILDNSSFLPVIKSIDIDPFSIESNNYFIITITAEGDISSILVRLASPTELNKTEVNLKKVDQNWSASFSIPSDFEKGDWIISEIIFTDKSGVIKKYGSNIIKKSFNVEKEVSLDILDTEAINEQKKQVCVQDGGIWDSEKIICKCSFNYSDWSECSSEGFRIRTILSSYPDNCFINDSITKEECEYVVPKEENKEQINNVEEVKEEEIVEEVKKEEIVEEVKEEIKRIQCIFTYSSWSECQPNGTQTRKSFSKMPANCSIGSPILVRNCEYVAPVKEEEIVEEKVILGDCEKAGITDKVECDMYLYKLKTVPACLSLGIKDKNGCREYFLNNYSKPLKCVELSNEECLSLIDNVILSELDTMLDEDDNEILSNIAGEKIAIQKENQKIIIKTENQEINVNKLPIVISEETSAILIPIEKNEIQQNLSSVGISINNSNSNLPDDVINRIGENYNIDKLKGVDKAIVEKIPLEQPKFSESQGEKLLVSTVKTDDSKLIIEGKAEPNQVITLFIYSSMPIVVTVETDQDGNWIYSLDKSMVDGTHEVYAVLHNDKGKIIESSMPKMFFIEEAQAVSIDETFLQGNVSQVNTKAEDILKLYLLGGISIIVILISILLIIKNRTEED